VLCERLITFDLEPRGRAPVGTTSAADTAPRFELRDYQREAVERVLEARRCGFRRLLVCLPTGAGKTVIFSELCRLARRPVLVLAHREELLGQARDKIERMTEGRAAVALEQGASRAGADAQVVVASLRSLHSARLARLMRRRAFGLIIYDECHHAAAEDNQRVLRELGCFEADWTGTLLGFTATTTRGDGVGLDRVFERIVAERSLLELVDAGYLVPLRGYRLRTSVDLQRVVARGASSDEEALSEVVDIEDRNELVARAIQELARDRRTIAFCVTVSHARNLARTLNHVGVPTGMVTGAMPRDRRAQTLAEFRAGRLAAITNVGVLTEGFDDPGVSCIAMARPTRSEGLYAQCVGRGTRLAPGKQDCLVLDFVDLSDLSLVTLPSLVGAPRQLDLQGATLGEAAGLMDRLAFDAPGFELEPTDITLGEIKSRARAFDPLTMELDPELSAITGNAWCSLGWRGLALFFLRADGRLSCVEILRRGVGRGGRYEVLFDGEQRARFTRIEEALEATDYEVAQTGRVEALSARDEAAWRQDPVPASVLETLAELSPPRYAASLGEALAYLAFAKHNPPREPRRQGATAGWPLSFEPRGESVNLG